MTRKDWAEVRGVEILPEVRKRECSELAVTERQRARTGWLQLVVKVAADSVEAGSV